MEFASEVATIDAPPERPVPIVRVVPASRVPAPRATAQRAASLPFRSRRLLWLTAGIVACAPIVWMALGSAKRSAATRAAPPQSAQVSPPSPEPPRPEVVVAAAMPAPRVEPAVIARSASKPPPTSSQPEQRRQRLRADRPAPVRRRLEAAATIAASAAPLRTSAGFHGGLVVESDPSGARVYVNGKPVGSTPLVLDEVPVGSRVMRVESDGYAAWSSVIRIVANQQTHVTATLRR